MKPYRCSYCGLHHRGDCSVRRIAENTAGINEKLSQEVLRTDTAYERVIENGNEDVSEYLEEIGEKIEGVEEAFENFNETALEANKKLASVNRSVDRGLIILEEGFQSIGRFDTAIVGLLGGQLLSQIMIVIQNFFSLGMLGEIRESLKRPRRTAAIEELEIGRQCYIRGDTETAKKFFGISVEKDPTFPTPYYFLVAIDPTDENINRGRIYIPNTEKELEFKFRVLLADIFFGRIDYRQSLVELQAADSLIPNKPYTRYLEAKIKMKAGDMDVSEVTNLLFAAGLGDPMLFRSIQSDKDFWEIGEAWKIINQALKSRLISAVQKIQSDFILVFSFGMKGKETITTPLPFEDGRNKVLSFEQTYDLEALHLFKKYAVFLFNNTDPFGTTVQSLNSSLQEMDKSIDLFKIYQMYKKALGAVRETIKLAEKVFDILLEGCGSNEIGKKFYGTMNKKITDFKKNLTLHIPFFS